jgi:Pyruvate/2-oxoacid:ferredoxin oxidoreductase delta subunit
MVTRRKIVRIDEEKCNGCGECATACAEGAIAIIDGKARLISETYCDGLGACLGECPQDAIAIEEREVEAFDAEAVEQHLHALQPTVAHHESLACGCPGSASQTIARHGHAAVPQEATPSELGNWPVQLMLVPTRAPYLQRAKVLISADCVPFAFADFHRTLLPDHVLLIGCPKLDDAAFYRDKLSEILAHNDIESIDVAYMEVPCCFGLVQLVRQAVEQSGKAVPVDLVKIGIRGEIIERQAAVSAATR